ncbi:MAG TPA: tRNA (guanosine(46)-N7)-methyltransferase TrmB, partial [Haploplasma sp.]|nr:tRNA (guanosine(46)-N7)-methyltransferase TrmB [Haploplasma sp.]
MRQKKLKHVDIDLMNELGVITKVKHLDTSNYSVVNLEIGSGKGQFITSLANDNKDELFIALERNINVCYRIVEKKLELKLDNLIVILGDSENLLEYLSENTVNNIFLNFSDPWPKARHHKRRLTYQPFLNIYKKLLVSDGILQLRTDHLDLFNDSLEYFENNFNIFDVNR